jgi:hypothetical protein
VQQHLQSGGTLLTGCAELAAHAAGNPTVTIADALAIQQFVINIPFGANNLTGKWRFIPPQRTYSSLSGTQPNENYSAYIIGDVMGTVVFPTPTPPLPPDKAQALPSAGKAAGSESPEAVNPKPVATVTLGESSLAPGNRSELIVPVTVSKIDPAIHGQLQAFQTDLAFDSNVINFQSPAVQKAGLTSHGNWSLMASVLGKDRMKTLRVSCFALDNGALSGSGTLFELRVQSTGQSCTSIKLTPSNFIFVDSNLRQHTPLNISVKP